MIPRVAHFVFGLREQDEPFHPVHFLAVESCRRVLAPDVIYFHHKHLPWGPYWERIRPYLTLVPVDLVDDVLAADYSEARVPPAYRYAHHADFIRLDALIEHGGVYADIDTVFVRPFPDDLFESRFVIGREAPAVDERTGEPRPSLCNALLLSEQGSRFARAWRERMAGELDGTWSNHSGFLSQALTEEMPAEVRVEPESTFFSFRSDREGLADLLERDLPLPEGALSVHLWAHLWWDRWRRDFSQVHSGHLTAAGLRGARTTLSRLARPYLATEAAAGRGASDVASPDRPDWLYLSLDEISGYGEAADRCRAALEDSGVDVEWTPFVPGGGWGVVLRAGAGAGPVRGPRRPGGRAGGVRPRGRGPPGSRVLPARPRPRPRGLPGRPLRLGDGPDPRPLGPVPRCDRPARRALAVQRRRHRRLERRDAGGGGPPRRPGGPPRASGACAHTGRAAVRLLHDRRLDRAQGSLQDGRGLPPGVPRIGPGPPDREDLEPRLAAARAGRPLAGGAGHDGVVAGQLLRRPPRPAGRPARHPALSADREIEELHAGGDCFVSLCRGEGWGLGAFDAAAHGNPVVITGFGGQLDYLAGSPYLVDFELVPVVDPMGFPSYAPDQRWAEPDLDHAAALLRAVAGGPEQATEGAGLLGEEIRHRYRPAAIADAFRAAVDAHRHTPPKAVGPEGAAAARTTRPR